MKELLESILELRMEGKSPEEISVILDYPYEKVVSALDRWLPGFIEED